MTNNKSEFEQQQAISSLNFSTAAGATTSSKADEINISRHPAINQLLALGYEFGDQVVGRNILVRKAKRKKNVDWVGVLTEDNIKIREYSWTTGQIALDGTFHENGLSWLEEQNTERQIYFNVNAGRSNKDISRWYALFFEEDTGSHTEQQAKIDAIPLIPSVQVRTRKSNHTYFTVWADEAENIEEWSRHQETIAYTMGSDPSVKDGPRLMRLAGFNHIKNTENGLEFVPCTLEQYGLNRVYSTDEVLVAFEKYAQNLGIKPFSEERFKAYQYVVYKLRQKIGHIYSHDLFNAEFFRTCEESEISEHLKRCKNWARLCEKKFAGKECDDPETAWSEDSFSVSKRLDKEFDFKLIPSKVIESEPLTIELSRRYTEGFNYDGRADWATAKCPVHGGNSNDSLHINKQNGALICHGGCTHHEVEARLRELAQDNGDERWNWQLWQGQEYITTTKSEAELLNSLVIQPNWHRITDCSIKKPWGLEFDSEVLKKIPSQAILILKAPMGGGKTKLIDGLINEIYRDSRVVSVTPTIALNRVLGNRLKIDIRDDIEAMGVNAALFSRIGFVCPSLWKLLGRDYGNHSIAILDEFRQSLWFLTHSRECDTYSARSQNIRALNEIVKYSDVIVLSDAYLTNTEVDYVVSLRPDLPVYVLEIPVYARDREIWEITDEAKIYELIDQFLEDGKSLIIPCDSQKTGEAIDEVYNTKYNTKSIEERYQNKGFKTFRLDRETKGGREQELFLNNPTEYVKAHPEIRLFIYSPTLGSGASIEDGHFDVMVGINTHLVPTDFRQQVGRFRPAIPLYYWASYDKPNKNNWSKSYYPSSHKKSIFDGYDRLKELSEIAAVEAPEDTCASTFNELCRLEREGLEGQSPMLDLICKQRARQNYLSRKRRDKLREQFNADGFDAKPLDAEAYENIDGGHKTAIKDAKDFIMRRRAIDVIKAPLVSDAEGDKLLNKRILKPEERIKAEKYKFNKMLPGFLGSIKDESEAIEFYYRHLKDGGRWVSSVFARWRWENRELLKAQDIKSLERLLGQFKDSGTDSPGDLDKLKTPYFKFLEEIEFFEEFGLGNEVTLKKVIRWLFKLNSEDAVQEIFDYSKLEDVPKAKKDAITKKYIKPLPPKYKRELEKYLGIILSSDKKSINYLIRNIGNVLSRFGFKQIKQRGDNNLGIYQVVDGDGVLQENYRKRLESIISEKFAKSGVLKAETPMVEGKNEQKIEPTRSITTTRSIFCTSEPCSETVSVSKTPDFEQKNKTYYNTTLDRECHITYSEPTECNDGAIQSPPTYRIPVFNQEHCDRPPEQKTLKSRLQEVKDFGMLIDVLNFVPLEAVKAAAEDLPPEYANVKRLVKFAVWDEARHKWVALPRYAHPGYTKPLRWIDAIAGINHISVPERVDREVKAAPW